MSQHSLKRLLDIEKAVRKVRAERIKARAQYYQRKRKELGL